MKNNDRKKRNSLCWAIIIVAGFLTFFATGHKISLAGDFTFQDAVNRTPKEAIDSIKNSCELSGGSWYDPKSDSGANYSKYVEGCNCPASDLFYENKAGNGGDWRCHKMSELQNKCEQSGGKWTVYDDETLPESVQLGAKLEEVSIISCSSGRDASFTKREAKNNAWKTTFLDCGCPQGFCLDQGSCRPIENPAMASNLYIDRLAKDINGTGFISQQDCLGSGGTWNETGSSPWCSCEKSGTKMFSKVYGGDGLCHSLAELKKNCEETAGKWNTFDFSQIENFLDGFPNRFESMASNGCQARLNPLVYENTELDYGMYSSDKFAYSCKCPEGFCIDKTARCVVAPANFSKPTTQGTDLGAPSAKTGSESSKNYNSHSDKIPSYPLPDSGVTSNNISDSIGVKIDKEKKDSWSDNSISKKPFSNSFIIKIIFAGFAFLFSALVVAIIIYLILRKKP